jgi:hypothetical protein
MALVQVTGALATWWLSNRRGSAAPTGTVYNGLVSDLAANDYLVGTRATVVSTGATSGTAPNQVRALTINRLGIQQTVSWPIGATVQLIR